jgi:hypothetical protein
MIALPVMLSFVGLPMIVLILPTVINSDPRKNLMFSSHVISPAMLGLAILIFLFVLFSGLYGPSLGKFNLFGKEAMPAFFAIRPMATSRFVLVKMIAAALGALAAWAILLVLLGVWAVVEASSLGPDASIVRGAWADASPRDVAVFIAALFGLLAIAWREIVNGMWMSLTGRKWLSVVIGVSMMVVFILAGIAGWWVSHRPDVQPHVRASVPWLVGLSAAAKLFVAAWVIMTLGKHRLVPHGTLCLWLGGWVLVGVILFATLSYATTPTLMLATILFLLLPLTRLAAAPLALRWNRHR